VNVLVIARSRKCSDNHLWREADLNGVNVSVLSSRSEECRCDRHSQHGLGQIKCAPAWSFGTDTSRWIRNLKSELDASKPDLIHIDSEPWSLQVRNAIKTGLPVVPHAAENIIGSAPWWFKLRRTGLTSQLRKVAGLAFWGETSHRAIGEVFDLSSTPFAVVPACPPSPKDFSWRGAPIPTGVLRIGFVGSSAPYKGLPFLVSAIGRAGLGNGPVELHVLSTQGVSQSIQNVSFAEGIPMEVRRATHPREVADFMTKCDVIAVPSVRTRSVTEQWGRVAAEAQLMGIPVLLADTGELPNQATSLAKVLPDSDLDAWAHELSVLVADHRSERDSGLSAHHRPLIVQQEEVRARFSMASYVDAITNLWERALERAHV